MDAGNMIEDAAARLFADAADLQTIVSARNDAWRAPLWRDIEEIGLTVAAVPEEMGGAEVGIRASLGILRAAGRTALAVPLAETVLAGWLLGTVGIASPGGKLAFGPSGPGDRLRLDGDDRLSGHIERLPFAGDCGHAALLAHHADGLRVVLVDLAGAVVTPRDNLAFEAGGRVDFDRVVPTAIGIAPEGFTADAALLMGAAARSMQIAGALEEILRLTTLYVQQRPAFGRLVSKFQAVQHALAQLAGETSVSLSSAASAAEALETLLGQGRGFDDDELRLEVISAKIRTAEAARQGARIAHQLHGAIGVTREHVLHRLTLRVLAWRDDYGNETWWAQRLGELIAAGGAEGFWALVSRR